jgi:hypothetical protein
MTSRHSSLGGRRGLAPWIIVTAVVVVLAVGATVAYLFIVRSGDLDSAASSCSSQVVLTVAVAPGADDAITEAAAAFDATGPVARSACVTTSVTTVPAGTDATSLAAGWKQNPGMAPAMWVVDSEADLRAVEATDSGLTAGRDTVPIATSPVVLAVREADAAAASTLSWQNLQAQTGPDGTVALPANRQVILALPDPSSNRATSYALQSVLAAGAPGTSAPLNTDAVTAAAADLAQLGAGGPATQPATTELALTALSAGDPGFTAVPVVESDLTKFTSSTPGLVAVSPEGGAVGDAVWPVSLTAPWVTPTLKDAAARFASFLRSPAGRAALTDNGLQVTAAQAGESSAAGTSAAASVGATQMLLPDAGPDVARALASAVGATPAG